MRTFRRIHTAFAAGMAILFFTGCSKENSVPVKNPVPNSTVSEEMVLTPFGMMEKSKVHFVGEGFHLSVENGRLQKIESSSGRMAEDFGEVKLNDDRFNLRNASRFSDNTLPAAASGWIAYAYWSNTNTSKPITSFTTNWIVPSVPKTQSSQTIFLFNGMQDGVTSTSYIIQPVLQWGPSATNKNKITGHYKLVCFEQPGIFWQPG